MDPEVPQKKTFRGQKWTKDSSEGPLLGMRQRTRQTQEPWHILDLLLYPSTHLYTDFTVRCDGCLEDLMAMWNTTLFNQQTYKTLRQLSLYECAAECHGSRTCSSIYYEQETETCNLNTNGSNYVDNVSHPDGMYSERKHWLKIVAGPCFHSSCAIGSKCEVDRFGRMLCVADVKDCGEPPELPNADKLTDHHLEGGRTNYTCKPDFVACDASSMTCLCQPSGSWEEVDSVCRRFRWTIVV
ncbi:uncharacterized protein [Haliotis asinina]|uniref:uncharacterized protein n=1 Tax=Haliotis asinina TaxID=109174 RepID=UPI003531AD2F